MTTRLPILGLVLLALLGSGELAFGQINPCADVPATQLTTAPRAIVANLPDHNATVLGGTTPLVASYEWRYYAEGAPAPFQTVTLQKTDFTLVAGTTQCYRAEPSVWPLTPNVRYRGVLVAKASPGIADSPPSAESNPFGLPSPPTVGTVRVMGQ